MLCAGGRKTPPFPSSTSQEGRDAPCLFETSIISQRLHISDFAQSLRLSGLSFAPMLRANNSRRTRMNFSNSIQNSADPKTDRNQSNKLEQTDQWSMTYEEFCASPCGELLHKVF